MSTNSSSNKRSTRRSSRVSNTTQMDLNQPPTIDLEASDDEIQLLSSPRGFHQARSQSRRRNRSVIVVVDEERETLPGPSGVLVNDSEILSLHNRHNKRERVSPTRTIINCESSSISEDASRGKKRKLSMPAKEKVVPKEPVFHCPICMSTLVSPCSTVCGHIFCEACIKAAIQVKKQCPTCRTKLTMKNNVHKVFLPTTTAD